MRKLIVIRDYYYTGTSRKSFLGSAFNRNFWDGIDKSPFFEKIEILETLDSHTCEICQPLDGTVIPLAQYEPGVTVPPFHPNCRGTTCPHFADMDGERAARNAEGQVYYVPANMTYNGCRICRPS